MITTNERLALQHRKNQKNKSQLQASQDMINAFDKISVSVRRAYNVNRCQQDHLDSKVWSLENEHRKSMGLLAREQKRFLRARKSSSVQLKSDLKHRKRREKSNLSDFSKKDSLKNSNQLPSLLGIRKVQSEFPVKSYESRTVSGEGFVGSKVSQSRNPLHKRDQNGSHMPLIHETQLNVEQYKEKDDEYYQEHSPIDQWTSRNTGVSRIDAVDKQQNVASWDIRASEVTSTKTAKSYSNLIKSQLTSSQTQRHANKSICTNPKAKKNISCNNQINTHNQDESSGSIACSARRKNTTEMESRKSLLNTKHCLVRSSSNSTSDLESTFDRAIEIRVKKFLKLPPIGGIHEGPSNEHADCSRKELPHVSHLERRPSRVDTDTSYNTKHTAKRSSKSSLWKNLVHCRYLRLGEQHVCEHKIKNKNCECNWCAMMRKSRV